MKRTNKGFTLVEILIVVIILGILAAIVIPQFTEASNDARESALTSDLQTLRSQLELYKIQHLDTYPDVDDAAKFVSQMTSKTLQNGTVDAAGTYGPYLQSFPTNSFNQKKDVDIDGTAGDSSHGWHFNSTTGRISPDDSAAHAAM